MIAKLNKEIEIHKQVWLWTSLAIFVLLSLVNPTGTANSDSLLLAIIDLARPSKWAGADTGFLAASALVEFLYVTVFFAAVAFLSGLSGWLLHFLVAPFFHKPANAEPSTRPIPEGFAGQVFHKRIIVFSAVGGAFAAVFAGVVTELHGLQFWGIWFCYDRYYSAKDGFHSWSTFHSFFLLVIVCGLNAVVAAIIGKYITSDCRRVRLKAIIALGIQFALLLIRAENLGLDADY